MANLVPENETPNPGDGEEGCDGSGGDSEDDGIMNYPVPVNQSAIVEDNPSVICSKDNGLLDTTPRRNPQRSCNLNTLNMNAESTESDVEEIILSDSERSDQGSAVVPLKWVSCVDVEESNDTVQLSPNSLEGTINYENNQNFNDSVEKKGLSEVLESDFSKTMGNDSNPAPNCDGKSEYKQNVPCDWSETEDYSTPKTSGKRLSRTRLSLSSRKAKKKPMEEYDPDNDIFMHGDIPTRYNFQKLRKEIGKFLSTSDIATYCVESPEKRKDDGENKNSFNDSLQSVSSASPCTPKKRSAKRVKAKVIKRTSSVPDLRKLCMNPVSSPVNTESTASRLQSLLAAHETLRQIKQRTNNFSFLTSHIHRDNNRALDKNDCVSPTEDLPPTQPFSELILKDVVAYVDVIFENEERSACVRDQLEQLGAKVVYTFTRQTPVTHVIFNEGHISTYKKAKKRNIPLVSILWIEECKKTGLKISERKFPAKTEEYESPQFLKKMLKKRKIIKERTDETPKLQRGRIKAIECTPPTEKDSIEGSKHKTACVPPWVEDAVGDDGALRFLVEVTGIKEREFNDLVNSGEASDDSEIVTPLALRLLKKLALDRKAQEPAKTENDAEKSNGSCKDSEIEQNGEEVTNVSVSDGTQSAPGSSQATPVHGRSINLKVCKRKLLPLNDKHSLVELESTSVPSIDIENPHSSPPPRKKVRKADTQNVTSLCEDRVEDSSEQQVSDKKEEQSELLRRSRRSSVDFIQRKFGSTSSPTYDQPGIVCTLLNPGDVEMIGSVITKLGGFIPESSITARTSHVVCGSPKRTMKILKGMARGCWIVKVEWVFRSLEEGRWVDEEEYELKSPFPATSKYRLEKLSFGPLFKPDIFSSCGLIFISSKCGAPRADVAELIALCGGKTASKVGRAEIVVGKLLPDVKCVKLNWVLDSISCYSCKPFETYAIEKNKN